MEAIQKRQILATNSDTPRILLFLFGALLVSIEFSGLSAGLPLPLRLGLPALSLALCWLLAVRPNSFELSYVEFLGLVIVAILASFPPRWFPSAPFPFDVIGILNWWQVLYLAAMTVIVMSSLVFGAGILFRLRTHRVFPETVAERNNARAWRGARERGIISPNNVNLSRDQMTKLSHSSGERPELESQHTNGRSDGSGNNSMASNNRSANVRNQDSRNTRSLQCTVLVADDEPAVLEVIRKILVGCGYTVLTASDGEGALAIAASNKIDVALLDINMPGKSGLEVLQALRKSQPWAQVIIVTAVSDATVAAQAIKLGANDYILKPFGINELVSKTNEALMKRRFPKGNTPSPANS